MWYSYLSIAFGGAIGAITRVAMTGALPASWPIFLRISFINFLGCLVIGALTEGMAQGLFASVTTRHFLVQGLLGGFTTFSAFALEFGLLSERYPFWLAVTYAAVSVSVCLVAFFVGLRLVQLVYNS